MNEISQKEVELLNVISENHNLSQRKLSNNLDISVGMINIFIKKLTQKGLLKIKKTTNKNSLKYILTPKGFSERLKFNMYYLKKNLNYFTNAKKTLITRLEEILKTDVKSLYIMGTDEWSELMYLAIQDFDFNLKGFISLNNDSKITTKFNHKVFNQSIFDLIDEKVNIILNIEEKKYIDESNFENKNLKFYFF